MRKHAGKFKLRLMNLQHFRIFSETSGIIHKIFSLSEKKKNSHKNGSFFLLEAISFTHSSQISGTSIQKKKSLQMQKKEYDFFVSRDTFLLHNYFSL